MRRVQPLQSRLRAEHENNPAEKFPMEYYDLKRNWRRVRPHLSSPRVAETLVRDFNKFTYGRWDKRFLPGMVPHQFESCDWWCDHRGRLPAYWQYTKHAACHWLVNFTLELAQVSVPNRSWRILTSPKHSTVWDGEQTLFDLNFLAMGVPPDECFALARRKELRPGEHKRVYFAQHWREEVRLHEAAVTTATMTAERPLAGSHRPTAGAVRAPPD